MDHVIYLITCKVSGKMYIGLTKMKIESRFRHHASASRRKGRRALLHNAIRKYGEDNFGIEIIRDHLSLAEARECEISYIRILKTRKPHGYNLTEGGEGAVGSKMSATGRAAISAAAKKRFEDLELRKRYSDRAKKQWQDLSFRAHVSKSVSAKLIGRKMSPEFCASVSARMVGNTHLLGYKHTAEAKQRIGAAASGPMNLSSEERERRRIYALTTLKAFAGNRKGKRPWNYRGEDYAGT